jgi:hypothetical protein
MAFVGNRGIGIPIIRRILIVAADVDEKFENIQSIEAMQSHLKSVYFEYLIQILLAFEMSSYLDPSPLRHLFFISGL